MNKQEKMIKQLIALGEKWCREADEASKKSADIWKKLSTDELPQEDEIIYSVYELSSESQAILGCVEELSALLKKIMRES